MCGSCGCGRDAHPGGGSLATVHAHEHDPAAEVRRVAVERSLLAENAARADALRKRLAEQGVDGIGLVGAPGSGKTTLLEATLARLGPAAAREAVVEGDCATDLDARRIAARGARVVQVATGSLCHLDAHLVEHALEALDLEGVSRLWIENVGNLVCPAPFPCGEARRVVLVSAAEGDDKPEKYPAIFAGADLLVVTKADLLPHVDFDVDRCLAGARQARPGLPALVLSARTGEGLGGWLAWLGGEGS
jgi:hydrogenase nickel incorporation protein HypB